MSLPLLLLLVAANAALAAGQFLILRLRSARLRELDRGTSRLTDLERRIADRATVALAAAQLGITAVSLGIGTLAGPALGPFLLGVGLTQEAVGPLDFGLAAAIALGVTTLAGQAAAEYVSRRYPESVIAPSRSVDLGRLTVRDLMVPRTRIDALPANLSVEDARERMLESGRARIPVYRENLDEIVGMLEWARLFGPTSADWAAAIEPMVVVPESMAATDALARMRERPVPEVLVVDEYGGTAGLLTMAAVAQVAGRRPPASLPASVPGEHPIHLLERDFAIDFPQTEASTIGGFMAERLGHLPTAGDAVEVDGHHLIVAAVVGRRIRTIRVE